jgi:hypothetical protein
MLRTLTWTNSLTYAKRDISQIVGIIKSFGSIYMPLTEEKYQSMVEYAANKNLPVELIYKIRNQARIQAEVENSQRIKDDAQRIREELYHLQDSAHLSPSENSIIIDNKLRQLNAPLPIIINILKSDFDLQPLYHSNYIQTLMKTIQERESAIRNRAFEYERILEDWFRSKNIEFQTEEELRAEGRSNTPDILLRQPIKIKIGKSIQIIHWIDAKDSTLVNFGFIVNKLRKQAMRYTKEFGHGAMIFSGGIDPTVLITGALVLDGSPDALEKSG